MPFTIPRSGQSDLHKRDCAMLMFFYRDEFKVVDFESKRMEEYDVEIKIRCAPLLVFSIAPEILLT